MSCPDTEESRPAHLGAIIVAAGESRRMGNVDKIFTPLIGLPLITHTVEAFENCPLVRDIVLVLSSDNVSQGQALAREQGWRKIVSVCQGGERRQDSVRLGLERLPDGRDPWIVVHDGARPCLDPDILGRGLDAAQETGAAVAAVPSKDTIKVVSPSHLVKSTPPRDTLWMVQTPQVFRYDLLLQAHRTCENTVTDDASMVESLGHKVKVFMGSYSNIKVTTPEDLAVAEIFLRAMDHVGGQPNEGNRWRQG